MTTDKGNIILVTYDSVRGDHCSYSGYKRNTTPNLDKMAEDGIDFQQAVSPASRTNPSMSGIMTGEPLLNREMVSDPAISRNHLRRYTTIAEELSKQGYSTAGFCPNAYASRHFGFDKGFDYFEDFLFNSDSYRKLFEKHLSDSGIFTSLRNVRNLFRGEEAFRTWDSYIEDIIEWSESQNYPFFIWIFALDTHYPYITPRSQRKWGNTWKTYYYNYRCNSLINEFNVELSKREKQGIIDIYDDALRYGDQLLGELTNRLAGYDPTYIVHSDHGEAFGEHGFYGHFYPSLYAECTHVPFVIWNDGLESNTVTKPFSILNTPRVIKHAAKGGLNEFEVKSQTALSTTYDGRHQRNLVSYYVGDYKIISEMSEGKAQYEIYNMAEDPLEEDPLTEHQELAKILRQLVNSRFANEEEQFEIRRAAQSLAKKEQV